MVTEWEGEGARVVRVEMCLSSKGFAASWLSSLDVLISLGPNEVAANGERAGGLAESVCDLKPPSELAPDERGALITSALTTPSTWRTLPLIGVMIMGASLRKSLAKLAPDMYEFLDDTPDTPDTVDKG